MGRENSDAIFVERTRKIRGGIKCPRRTLRPLPAIRPRRLHGSNLPSRPIGRPPTPNCAWRSPHEKQQRLFSQSNPPYPLESSGEGGSARPHIGHASMTQSDSTNYERRHVTYTDLGSRTSRHPETHPKGCSRSRLAVSPACSEASPRTSNSMRRWQRSRSLC